jgi:hypothetical protein
VAPSSWAATLESSRSYLGGLGIFCRTSLLEAVTGPESFPSHLSLPRAGEQEQTLAATSQLSHSLPSLRRHRRRLSGVAGAVPVAAGPSPREWSGGAVHDGSRRCVSAVSDPGAAQVVLVAVARPLGSRTAVVVGGLSAGRLSAAGGVLPAQI